MRLKWKNKDIDQQVLVDNPVESNFTEDLDSATVMLNSLSERLDIEILDEVELYAEDENVSFFFCVGDYSEAMVNPADPHYDYTISLISQTKELEGIILPNLSITKTDRKRSVWYYINTYLDLYSQKIRYHGPAQRLPSGYQEVSYIQSSGTQYIDTGVKAGPNIDMSVDYQAIETTGAYVRGVAGARESASSKAFGFGYAQDGKKMAQYGTQSYINDRPDQTLYRVEVALDDILLYYDDVFIHGFNMEQFTGYGSIYLFAFNEPIIHPSSIRVYGCKIYKNDVMLRNFVPCYRVSDGAIGLYDTIDRLFYGNIGTGEFTKGTDVGGEVGDHLKQRWIVSADVEEKFKSIECPEMQWNRPTLREVLTDLMMVGNCIPTLNDGVLGMLDLGNRNGNILLDDFVISVNRSKSIEDYTSEVEMELQNVVQDSADGVYNLTNAVEYTGFRNESEYALNTDNVKIYTKNPIYDIKHFWLCANLKIIYGIYFYTQYEHVEIDLCDVEGLSFVKEHKEFMTLPIAYRTDEANADDVDTDSLSEMAKYQNFNVSYVRGGKEIDGNFFDETKKFWLSYDTFLKILLRKVVKILTGNPGLVGLTWGTASSDLFLENEKIDLKDISFKVEYQTLANTKFKAGKYLPYENERVIVDNQTNSYVNANKQGILEYLKINRLGNEVLVINSRYRSLGDATFVRVGGTYKDDFVIFKKQIQINKSYVNVVYYATKHYVLRDYFTGVKAKIRSWKIESEESLVRNELHKYYYEFSFSPKTIDDEAYLPIPESQMLSPFFTHFEDEVIKWGFVRSMIGYVSGRNGPYEDFMPDAKSLLPYLSRLDDQYLVSELNSKVMGASIVFDTQMNDNWSGGVGILRSNGIIQGTSYPVEQDVVYVDNLGELREMRFSMAPEMSVDKADDLVWSFPNKEENTWYWFDRYPIIESDAASLKYLSLRKPLATEHIFRDGADIYEESYPIYKDQREIPALSLQLEYCSDTSDIVFGSQFVKDNNLVSTNYRTKYEPVTYTITGELIAISIFEIDDGQPINTPQPTREGLMAIGSDKNYYVSELEPAYGQLYDLNITKDAAEVVALGSALANKYEIGVTYTYTYPSGVVVSDSKNIGFTDIPEAYTSLPDNYPASQNNGKYAVAWTYQNLRMASDFRVLIYTYSDSVAVGGSTGIPTNENNTYRVVKKVIDQTVGELASLEVFYWPPTPSWMPKAEQNTGKYVAIVINSYTRLYVSDGTQWVWAEDSNGKHIFLSDHSSSDTVSYCGPSYTFRYNDKNYYASTGNIISWKESTGFRLDLIVSNGSYWILSQKNYTDDTTNVYFYAPVGYRMWRNEAWSDSITASKSYKWFRSNGSFWFDQGQITNGSIGYIGDDPDRISTQWYSYSSASWSYLGNTEGTPTAYDLYTYSVSDGSVVPVSSSVMTENLFSYNGNNYRWKSSNPVGWERSDSFIWTVGATATGKYFTYDDRTYLFDGSQILYQSDRTPIRGVNREDLRLFRSNEKVRVYDMDYLPLDSQMTELQNWSYQISDNHIRLSGLAGRKTYYLTDSEKHVLLAFNAPSGTGGWADIYLNGYCLRNKKIYN